MVARDRGEKQGVTTKGYKVSFWGDEILLNWIVILVVQSCEYNKYTKNH